MLKKLSYKRWHWLLVSLLMSCSLTRIAWAHGEIPVMIAYGPYFFIAGIVTACIFSAVKKDNQVLAGIAGMFLGFLLVALLFLFLDIRLFWDNVRLILIGFIVYFLPAILVGIFIGFLFKKLKRVH